MAKQNDQIVALVEKELKKDPKAPTASLQEKAAKIKKGVSKMSLRSFHGRYVGAVKSKLSGKKGGPKKGTKKKAAAKKAAPRKQRASGLAAVAQSSRKRVKSLFDTFFSIRRKK